MQRVTQEAIASGLQFEVQNLQSGSNVSVKVEFTPSDKSSASESSQASNSDDGPVLSITLLDKRFTLTHRPNFQNTSEVNRRVHREMIAWHIKDIKLCHRHIIRCHVALCAL